MNSQKNPHETIEQHVEEAISWAQRRRKYLHAPNVDLDDLEALDEQLTVHLRQVIAAGESGWRGCEQALASVSAGGLFTAAVVAIESNDDRRLHALWALAERSLEARPGFLSALGWVSPELMRQVGSLLLSSANVFARYAGIAGCSMHGLDPGLILTNALKSPESLLRARALRAAGELGRRDLLAACAAATRDGDEDCRFWAAWSAVRLGDRGAALECLLEIYRTPSLLAERAASLTLLALDLPRAHAILRDIARDPRRTRLLIEGAGWVGDSVYAPWLIEQMDSAPHARVAGEAFSMITGVDLEAQALHRTDAEDFDIDRAADEGLPRPDAAQVSDWWNAQKSRFTPGVRTFMGAPLSSESCWTVLRSGYQRQRRMAALHRALQNPAVPMFDCRLPASRQRWILA